MITEHTFSIKHTNAAVRHFKAAIKGMETSMWEKA